MSKAVAAYQLVKFFDGAKEYCQFIFPDGDCLCVSLACVQARLYGGQGRTIEQVLECLLKSHCTIREVKERSQLVG